MAGARQQHATRPVPPGPRQRGQAGHRPRRITTATGTLHAVVQPDGGGLCGAVVACQCADLFGRNAADHRRPLRAPLQGPRPQCVPAQGVLGNVVVVEPVVGDQLMHQRQCQRRIGAWQQGDVFMAFVGGLGLARVDTHQPCAVAFGLLGVAPEVEVAGNRVAAPDQDQLCFGEMLHLHADLAAQRLHQPFGPR